ncbi:MAG: hypothetical protein RRZ92_03070 [Bacilli bacterium]
MKSKSLNTLKNSNIKRLLILLLTNLILTILVMYIGNNWIIGGIYFSFSIIVTYINHKRFIGTTTFDENYVESLDLLNSLIINISSGCSFYDVIDKNEKLRKLIKEDELKTTQIAEIKEKMLILFPYKFYLLFFDIYDQYINVGGDFLKMSESLLNLIKVKQFEIIDLKENYTKRMSSFYMLWTFSFLVIIIARIVLSNYFETMSKNLFFLVLLLVSFIMFDISIFITYLCLLDRKNIKDENYEKV